MSTHFFLSLPCSGQRARRSPSLLSLLPASMLSFHPFSTLLQTSDDTDEHLLSDSTVSSSSNRPNRARLLPLLSSTSSSFSSPLRLPSTEWYKFAIDNDVIIIDEYDQLIEDLRPFWLLSGKEVRRRSVQVGLLPSVDLVRVEDGKTRTIDVNTGFDDAEVGARAKGFRVMLEKFQGQSQSNERCEGGGKSRS